MSFRGGQNLRAQAAREKLKKTLAVRHAYQARQAEPGATTGVNNSVVKCDAAKATLTVKLVSTSPALPIVDGTVEFAFGGQSITKPAGAGGAFLPLNRGAKVRVTGRVTNPVAGSFREAEVVAEVVVAAGEAAERELRFTPTIGVQMLAVTPQFFPAAQQIDLQYRVDDPAGSITGGVFTVRNQHGVIVHAVAMAAGDWGHGVQNRPAWWNGVRAGGAALTRADGPYSVRVSVTGGGETKSSELPTQVKTAVLQMHLDVDRDGAVDAAPANHAAWVWGPVGPGAIIAVCNRLPYLQAADIVPERSPLVFRWEAGVVEPGAWSATLAVSHPARIRIHDSQTRGVGHPVAANGAPALPMALPLQLNTPALQPVAVAGGVERTLWMQAANYPATNVDADWEITLTFTYTPPAGAAVVQTAVVRIAPWIMASDVDHTATVYSLAPAGAASIGHELAALAGGAFQGRAVPPADKPFFRDVLKFGVTDAPHYRAHVVLRNLDDRASAAVAGVLGGITAGGAGARNCAAANPTSQDNGGNLLVTPPVPDYPLGRILYGQAAGYDCNLETFLIAQRVQRPFLIDPTWLDVGHVDEFVSFVPAPGPGWPYRILLASPRLGYALAYAVAAQHGNPAVNRQALINQAVAENNAGRLAGENFAVFTARLLNAFGALPAAGALLQPAKAPGYAGDPPCPAGVDGRMVIWSDGPAFDAHDLTSYLQRVDPAAPGLFEAFAFNTVQPRIDASRLILRQALQFVPGHDLPEDRIIEVPVLLAPAVGGLVTANPDSVNLLLLNQAGAPVVIVPKPFGPVLQQHYVFEDLILADLQALGLTVHFRNDVEAFHNHHGEIHCGSNQAPVLPLQPARPRWWDQAPH